MPQIARANAIQFQAQKTEQPAVHGVATAQPFDLDVTARKGLPRISPSCRSYSIADIGRVPPWAPKGQREEIEAMASFVVTIAVA